MKYIRLANKHYYMRRKLDKTYKRQKLVQEYFEENNLSQGTPKEDFARYKISQVFDKWYFHRTKVKDLGSHYAPEDRYDYSEKFPFDLGLLVKDLEKVLPEMKYILGSIRRKITKEYNKDIRKGYSWASIPDRRRGWETYGFENIENDLSYVCDRWLNEFRIQWMIDLIHWWNIKELVTPTYKG